MADETLDGIIYGLRLLAQPGILERRDAFWAAVRADHAALSHLSKERLITVLKEMNPAYLVEVLQTHSLYDVRDRVVMSMRGKDRHKWCQALGIATTSDQTSAAEKPDAPSLR